MFQNELSVNTSTYSNDDVILQGDSGGPLTTVVKGQHVLIGDVSNGLACKGPYSIFGDVAHYRKWIDTTVYNNGGAVMCAA